MSAYQPSQRRAGVRRADRATTIRRIAALVAADHGMPIEDAWGFVTGGMRLGKWAREVELSVYAQLTKLRDAARRGEVTS